MLSYNLNIQFLKQQNQILPGLKLSLDHLSLALGHTAAAHLYSKGLCESVLMDWLAYSGR